MKHAWAWIAGICLPIAVGAYTANDHEAEADRQDAEALASRDLAARAVCKGRAFEWTDDKTLVCFKEVR